MILGMVGRWVWVINLPSSLGFKPFCLDVQISKAPQICLRVLSLLFFPLSWKWSFSLTFALDSWWEPALRLFSVVALYCHSTFSRFLSRNCAILHLGMAAYTSLYPMELGKCLPKNPLGHWLESQHFWDSNLQEWMSSLLKWKNRFRIHPLR